MNMMIDFFTMTSDKRKIGKTKQSVFSADANIYETCSIHNPRFRIAYNNNILACNYFSAFGRFYFIENVNFDNAGQMVVTGLIDVLDSYQTEIKNLVTTITRYENANLTTIPDTNIVIKNYDIINVYASDKSFDTTFGNYVLELYGG